MRLITPALLAALALLAAIAPTGARAAAATQPAWPETIGRLPFAFIPKAQPPARLTGDLTDPAWRAAITLPLNTLLDGQPAAHKTQVLLFCTDDALYLGFRCDGERAPAPTTAPSSATTAPAAASETVELRLEPAADVRARPYHYLIFDRAGKVRPGRFHIYTEYNFLKLLDEKWQPAIQTAVATSPEGQGWTLEARIPFADLHIPEQPKGGGTLWRMNAYRAAPGQRAAEYLSWSPTGTNSYHTAARMGYVLLECFASDPLVNSVHVAPPTPAATEEDRQWLKPLDAADIAEIDRLIHDLAGGDEAARMNAVAQLRVACRKRLSSKALVRAKIGAATDVFRHDQGIGPAYKAAATLYSNLADEGDDSDPLPPDTAASVIRISDENRDQLFWCYLPAGWDHKTPLPLIVSCHGHGGNGRLELGGWKALADKYQFILACPTAGMWSGGDLERLRVEEQAALSAVQQLKAKYPIDATRVMASGFSRGGPPAGFMALLHPDVFTHLCLRSTLFSRYLIDLAESDPAAKASIETFARQGRACVLVGASDAPQVIKAFPDNIAWFQAFHPAHFHSELVQGMAHSPAYPLAAQWFTAPTTIPATPATESTD